jgi:hypothetical protein
MRRPRHARRIPGATRPDAGPLRKSADRVRWARSSCRPPGASVRRFCRSRRFGVPHRGGNSVGRRGWTGHRNPQAQSATRCA